MTNDNYTSPTSWEDPNASASEFLEALFRVFPDMLFSLKKDGRIVDYRVGEAAKLYLPPEKVIGKTIQEILPAAASPNLERGVHEASENGKTTSIHYQSRVQSQDCWFEAHMVPNKKSGVIVIIHDITNQALSAEQLQRQLRRMSALHSVDAAITSSFDLNVTLSVILRQALNQLNADAADVLLFNPITRLLEYAAGLGFRTRNLRHIPIMLGQGFAGQAALERRTISVPDLASQLAELHGTSDFLQEQFTAYHAIPLIAKGQVKGVLEIYRRSPFNPAEEWVEFLSTLAGQAAVAIDSASLFQELQRSNAELTLAYDSALESWAQFLDISGRESREHIFRVVDLSIRLAQSLRVSDSELIHYRRGALLHDIGKVGIPDAIINKPGPLSETEWQIVHNYPNYSYQILASLQHLGPALDIPRYHHERWDGSGYPYGMRGAQIPFSARVVGLVDVYDALLSQRAYRPAWSKEATLSYLRKNAGTLFDPSVVENFLGIVSGEEFS